MIWWFTVGRLLLFIWFVLIACYCLVCFNSVVVAFVFSFI